MTRLRTALAKLLVALLIVGCAGTRPKPLAYAAVDMPMGAIPATLPGPPVVVAKTVVLPNIRLPEDVAGFLRELQTKAATPVLRDVDLELTTSLCFFICINTDTATANSRTQ